MHLDRLQALAGSTVMITGGCGLVGSALAKILSRIGAHVLVLDTLDAYPFDYNQIFGAQAFAEVHMGDICDEILLRDLMRRSDFVIHAAAYADVAGCIRNWQKDYRVNVAGTMAVLDAACAIRPRRFLFISSASVYGNLARNRTMFDDGCLQDPISTYANSKLWGERQTILLHKLHGLDASVARYFSVYGPPQVPKKASHSWCVAVFAMRAALGLPLVVNGDGCQLRDFIFIDDIVTGTLLGLIEPAAIGRAYNVGSGIATSVLQVARLIQREFKFSSEIHRGPAAAGDPMGGAADLSTTAELLDWVPRIEIEDGIKRYCDWLRANLNLIPSWLST